MLDNAMQTGEGHERAIEALRGLRRFTGIPSEFWPAFAAAAGELAGAVRAILILRNASQPAPLKKLAEWSSPGPADRTVLVFQKYLPEMTERCLASGQVLQSLEKGLGEGNEHFALGVSLHFEGTVDQCLAAFLLKDASAVQAGEALSRLRLAADVPYSYQMNQKMAQARQDVEKLAAVFDVTTLLNAEDRFMAAAMALCNGMATRFECDRVSLGWLENGYIRVKCISRTERFERQMAAVQGLEAAMEEAFDQDEEVVWPPANGVSHVTRDHEAYARVRQVENICSVPLKLTDQGIGTLSFERGAKPFTPTELQQFRVTCDQAVRRLADLKRHDGWFGARWARATREQLGKLLGPEHTWAKVLALAGVVALVLLLLPIYNYRVEGDFILRSDEVSFLTAPFDGYIQSVAVRPGDTLPAGGLLLGLNREDLVLEESMAVADQARYLREAEKARAANSLAEMRIAQALAEQAQARLDLIRYRLDRALIKAPFDGVVVDGDLRQRIGSPVKQGEALYKIARLDGLYVEAEINERRIHDLLDKVTGEIAFVAQPKLKFPVRIARIEPAAFPRSGENRFVLRCEIEGPIQGWWRPGMSGLCKLNVEKRTLLWILTHRTVDFLRMFFWW